MTRTYATAPRPRFMIAIAMMAAGIAARDAVAQEVVIGPNTYAVTVRHVDLHPGSPTAARRTLARLGDAALTACGASDTSLKEMRQATRKSPCWRESMAKAMARITDPALAEAWAQTLHPGA